MVAQVALSAPPANARAFARAQRDLVAAKGEAVSRPTIEKIRDAFVDVAKGAMEDAAQAHLGRAISALKEAAPALRRDVAVSEAVAGARRDNFAVVACLHIHDEASLRLRSFEDTEGAAPNRGKRSAVQQHAVWLQAADGAPQVLPVELDALQNKKALTLATSLDKVVRSAAAVARRGVPADEPAFFAHVLVGDGIATNGAAARILRAKYEAAPVAPRFHYYQMVVKCSNHQANLVIGSLVEGAIAKEVALQLEVAARAEGHRGEAAQGAPDFAGARSATSAAKEEPHNQASGHIVRLFKYLMADYYSEFFAALVAHVDSLAFKLRSDQAAARGAPEADAQAARLEQLYGPEVLPLGVRAVLNGGVGRWCHFVPIELEGDYRRDPAVYQAAIRARFTELLRKHFLTVDEHPTYSRMFTFASNVHKLLGMIILGLVDKVVRLVSVCPKEKNRGRLNKVRDFAKQPQALHYLKRTSLALQLSQHTHSICAQMSSDTAPPLVKLANGSVRIAVLADFQRVAALAPHDPALSQSAVVTVLLGVVIETLVRFQQYEDYPFLLHKLCASFNEQYLFACKEFLRVPDGRLDVGLGLRLKQRAWSWQTEEAAIAYLTAPPVQRLLRAAFEAACSSSLPAERKLAEVKKSEAPRLCHVAVASRNHLLRLFRRWREARLLTHCDVPKPG